jgi:hypothetical protein
MLDAGHIEVPHSGVHDFFIRRRCRNARCQARLKQPTTDPRNAFCSRGCFEAHFKKCCLVCECPLSRRKTGRPQRFCRHRCQLEFHRHPARFLGKWGETADARRNPLGNADSTGLKTGTKGGRGYCEIAGPPLSKTVFRLASLPLDPGLVARLERAHRPCLEARQKAKRAASRRALIEKQHPPINVLGGHHFAGAPAIDLSPTELLPDWAIASRWAPTGAGAGMPDLPEFLRRVPTKKTRESSAVEVMS